MAIEIVQSAEDLRRRVSAWREDRVSLGFVPTMGALHQGHLALVRRAVERTDRVIASIFVNPTQFGPHEDYESYPRDSETDAAMLESAGCDLLFLPEVETLYPPGHSTWVEVGGIAEGLEGDQRPGHFRGVATVVTQLLNLVQPDIAVFGKKDAQQLAVVRRLVRDLHIPVAIEGVDTVRDREGLAVSSRNLYLSESDRQAATVLYRALAAARSRIEEGERSAPAIRTVLHETLATESRLSVDYADVVDAVSFQPVENLQGMIAVPVAGRIGNTRLLDSIHMELED